MTKGRILEMVLYEIYCRDCGKYLTFYPQPLGKGQFALCKECGIKAKRPTIEIPFTPDMAQASLEDRKTATTRTKRYGKPGDTFYIEDVLHEITGVEHLILAFVRAFHFRKEGFDSPEAFEAKWKKLHPRKGFVPEWKVWFHEYKKL